MLESEQIIENGTVTEVSDKYAKAVMIRNDKCKDCGSMFCNISSKQNMSIDVLNTCNAKIGDEVEISIGGDTLLNLSLLIYGIPILIAVAMIALGMNLIHNEYTELISVAMALVACTIYFFGFWWVNKNAKTKPKLPRITKILKHSPEIG